MNVSFQQPVVDAQSAFQQQSHISSHASTDSQQQPQPAHIALQLSPLQQQQFNMMTSAQQQQVLYAHQLQQAKMQQQQQQGLYAQPEQSEYKNKHRRGESTQKYLELALGMVGLPPPAPDTGKKLVGAVHCTSLLLSFHVFFFFSTFTRVLMGLTRFVAVASGKLVKATVNDPKAKKAVTGMAQCTFLLSLPCPFAIGADSCTLLASGKLLKQGYNGVKKQF